MNSEASKYEVAQKHIQALEEKVTFSDEELFLFQKFALFDYLIGNLDRHEENWMLIMQEGRLTAIKAIDNENAFPKKHPPEGSIAARNMYKWKSLKIAQQPFTEEALAFLRSQFTEENKAALLQELTKGSTPFLDEEMQAAFEQRWDTILAVAAGSSPKSLAIVS